MDILLPQSKQKAPRTYPDSELDIPCRYNDFESDASGDVAIFSHHFRRGITHMKAAWGQRTLLLNSYGPRNSAVTIWEPNLANSQAENVLKFHRNALQRTLDKHSESILSLRGKVEKMIAVAWYHKGDMSQMQDLFILGTN